MKKFVKIMAVALVAVMAIAVLASCGGGAPNSDPKKAISALQKNGYETSLSFVAADGVIAKAACDAAGATLGVKEGECIAMVVGMKLESEDDEDGEMIMIYYFSSAAIAKDVWESEAFKAIREEALEDAPEDAVVNISGAMIFIGTKQAVKDAR